MPLDLNRIASTWGCSPRTARRWVTAGAPVGDAVAMRRWLAGRQNRGRGTSTLLNEQARERRQQSSAEAVPAIAANADTVGAAHALKRLEDSELVAYKMLQSALASGDPHEIKNCREGWLKISDSLRHFDLLVAESRRDAGELVPRKEIEAHVSAFVYFFKLACRRTVNALAPNLVAVQSPAEIQSLFEQAVFEDILNALAAMAVRPSAKKLPDWFLDSAIAPMEDTLTGATEGTKARAKALEDALEAMAEETARQVAEPSQQPAAMPNTP